MVRFFYQRALVGAICFGIGVSGAWGVTLKNVDSETQVVGIREKADHFRLTIDGGDSKEICLDGCFITMPSGDDIALKGDESVDIFNGNAIVY